LTRSEKEEIVVGVGSSGIVVTAAGLKRLNEFVNFHDSAEQKPVWLAKTPNDQLTRHTEPRNRGVHTGNSQHICCCLLTIEQSEEQRQQEEEEKPERGRKIIRNICLLAFQNASSHTFL
jgi:hypothetical protein